MDKEDGLRLEMITDEQIAKLEKTKKLLSEIKALKQEVFEKQESNGLIAEILEMQQNILFVADDERKAKALQAAIDFKTKSAIHYITYSQNGEKILCLMNTEDSSTIFFKVESVQSGINSHKFHPEKMFEPITE